MKEGICVAGSSIVDILYSITTYPGSGELCHINEIVAQTTGGGMNNVIMDLAALDPALPLEAVALIGDDEEGRFIRQKLGAYPNISQAGVKDSGRTSMTLVMSEEETKQRTFFQYAGACGEFCEDHIDWDSIHAKLFHIAYILLLPSLDAPDDEYGTKMARLLHHAQQHGLKTSIDVVSERGNRFHTIVPPALKYTDYCVINEVEAGQATGVELRGADGKLDFANMKQALSRLFEMGVSAWAVIHAPEAGCGMDAAGNYVELPSLKLPEGYIKGTVGAGDAFCAGVLYGAYNEVSLEEAIVMGIASAACSLSQEGSTEGMRTMKEALELYQELR